MHQLKAGDQVGIRGPLGNCWPMEDIKGMDLLVITGGCGCAPLRPAIYQVFANRRDYRRVLPALRLKDALRLRVQAGFRRVGEAGRSARADDGGRGRRDLGQERSVVTTLLPQAKVNPESAVALICGPPIMIKFSAIELLKGGFSEDRIVTSLSAT